MEKSTSEYYEREKKDIKLLRLPVGHSELNPIELIWAQMKNEVARKNVTFNITDVKKLMEEAMAHVTPNNWKKAVGHVKKVEAAFRKLDFGDEETAPMVDKMFISVTDSDDETSDDELWDDSDDAPDL